MNVFAIFLNDFWRGVQVQGLQFAIEQRSSFKQRLLGHQSPHPAAAATLCVLNPFDADLHKRLLAGLDPPVEQVGTTPQVNLHRLCRSFLQLPSHSSQIKHMVFAYQR